MLGQDFPHFLVELIFLLEFLVEDRIQFLDEQVLAFDDDFPVLLQMVDDKEGQMLDLVLVQPHDRIKYTICAGEFKEFYIAAAIFSAVRSASGRDGRNVG
jgi:hypothetical protein